VDARKQAEKRPFDHYVIPRLTSFRAPLEEEGKEPSIQRLYAVIAVSEPRNQRIVEDVLRCFQSGGNALVLTERTAHVAVLAAKLREQIPDAIALTGGKGVKETREALTKVSEAPAERPLTLIATGRYIGEGFDEPRLDTLFLAMPISWKGTPPAIRGQASPSLVKTSGRFGSTTTSTFMFPCWRRCTTSGWRDTPRSDTRRGRKSFPVAPRTSSSTTPPSCRFTKNDLLNAVREILIVSPFVTKRRVSQDAPLPGRSAGAKGQGGYRHEAGSRFQGEGSPGSGGDLGVIPAAGIQMVFKSNIHQKFAVFDQKIVWYGSINLLSFGRAEESIMRLENPNIADELLGSIQK